MLRKITLRKITVPLVFVVAIAAAGLVLAAGPLPTPHQIYQAAESGQIAQAEQMVSDVLAARPKSGKAHYIAAEVYARAGDFATARHEFATAESLEPGLPFADAHSVAELRAQLAQGRSAHRVQFAPVAPYARHRSSVPWGLILIGVSVLVIIWSLARRRRQMAAGYPQYPGQPYPGQPYPGQPMGMPPGGVVPPGAPYPYGYGGTGSGLMHNIGTGLAVGAGVAAGEALVGKMLGGGQAGGVIPPANAGEIIEQPPVNDDMGGADFGVSGNSWDDGGGGGGADFGTGGDFGGGGDDWT